MPSCRLDLRDIRVVTKLGGTVDDSEMVEGMVFDQKAAKAAGGPTRVENAKVALVQFHISPPKTDIENNVIISDYAQVRGRCQRLGRRMQHAVIIRDSIVGCRQDYVVYWQNDHPGGARRWTASSRRSATTSCRW